MPYITESNRKWLSECIWPTNMSPGELNYIITQVLDRWLAEQGVSYANLNAAIGILECAKLELYRRVASPYEDQKKHDNGDVYTCLNK